MDGELSETELEDRRTSTINSTTRTRVQSASGPAGPSTSNIPPLSLLVNRPISPSETRTSMVRAAMNSLGNKFRSSKLSQLQQPGSRPRSSSSMSHHQLPTLTEETSLELGLEEDSYSTQAPFNYNSSYPEEEDSLESRPSTAASQSISTSLGGLNGPRSSPPIGAARPRSQGRHMSLSCLGSILPLAGSLSSLHDDNRRSRLNRNHNVRTKRNAGTSSSHGASVGSSSPMDSSRDHPPSTAEYESSTVASSPIETTINNDLGFVDVNRSSFVVPPSRITTTENIDVIQNNQLSKHHKRSEFLNREQHEHHTTENGERHKKKKSNWASSQQAIMELKYASGSRLLKEVRDAYWRNTFKSKSSRDQNLAAVAERVLQKPEIAAAAKYKIPDGYYSNVPTPATMLTNHNTSLPSRIPLPSPTAPVNPVPEDSHPVQMRKRSYVGRMPRHFQLTAPEPHDARAPVRSLSENAQAPQQSRKARSFLKTTDVDFGIPVWNPSKDWGDEDRNRWFWNDRPDSAANQPLSCHYNRKIREDARTGTLHYCRKVAVSGMVEDSVPRRVEEFTNQPSRTIMTNGNNLYSGTPLDGRPGTSSATTTAPSFQRNLQHIQLMNGQTSFSEVVTGGRLSNVGGLVGQTQHRSSSLGFYSGSELGGYTSANNRPTTRA